VDLGSWGVTATTIKNSRLWWQGPEWLSRVPDEWPSMNVEPTLESQVDFKTSHWKNTLLAAKKKCSIARIIDVNAYSSCTKLFRVTAYVYRFAGHLKMKVKKVKNLAFGNLAATEVKEVEDSWVKEAQSGLTDQTNFKQIERDLGLYSDEDDVIRCSGRIPKTVMEYKEKHPAFLPEVII